ncbi:MAG: type II toxin-antitoxin system VapB family antitoxin [Candidatus Obscuribacterales bacterium]|nr:type II toxin-antitoxin system VapB family antitoxin [Candidatus Obscuribacterales bacterium]
MHRTNIELDEKLVKKAMKLTRLSTKKELVNYALAELVRQNELKGLLDLEGKIQWVGDLAKMRESRV